MPKLEISSQQRRDLRAAAHPLHPVVMVGDRGLTDSVLQEIDHSLNAHNLIKIRVSGAERTERESMLDSICEALSCAAVHHLGKILIIYRPEQAPEAKPASVPVTTRAERSKSGPHIPKKRLANGAPRRMGSATSLRAGMRRRIRAERG